MELYAGAGVCFVGDGHDGAVGCGGDDVEGCIVQSIYGEGVVAHGGEG